LAIANLEQKEDLSARYYAAWWLGRFRVKEQKAIAILLMALEIEVRVPDQRVIRFDLNNETFIFNGFILTTELTSNTF